MQRGAEFSSPAVAKEYLRTKLSGFEHEVFTVLFLDTRHRLIEYAEMFRGTTDSAPVYPSEVVKEALRLDAAAVILSHNHPSGHPEPSVAEKRITYQLKDALALIDIRTLDHFIVAGSHVLALPSRKNRARLVKMFHLDPEELGPIPCACHG